MLQEIHERLAGVVIECMDWAAFVCKYDRPGTLFYMDPPYYGCERDYGDGMFSRDQFEQMAVALSELKGRFILSLNDTPEVCEIFSGFRIEHTKVTYTVGGADKAKAFGEVIITGPLNTL